MMITWASYAQEIGFSLQSPNQQLIENAAVKGLFVVKQEYILKDTVSVNPKSYGRNGNPYFGIGYGLGAIVNGSMIVDSEITTPWNSDANYAEQRGDKKKRPQLSKRYYRNINQRQYTAIPLQTSVATDSEDYVYAFTDSTFIKGFTMDVTGNEKDGWVIVLSGEESQIDTLTNFQTNIYRAKVNFANEDKYEMKKIPINKKLLGGFYIVPFYPNVGEIQFLIGGLIKEIDDKWYIIPFNTRSAATSILTPIEEPQHVATKENKSPSKKKKK